MIVIIDGYNILKSRYKESFLSKECIDRFVRKLEVYSKVKNHKIILVFDGGEFRWANYIDKSLNLKIVETGYHNDADSYIINYIESNRHKDIIVVSNDNEIKAHAAGLNMPVIDSDAFYQILDASNISKNIIEANSSIKKFSNNSNQELDALMINTNVQYKKEDSMLNNSSINQKKNSKKLSKLERKLLKIIKKL